MTKDCFTVRKQKNEPVGTRISYDTAGKTQIAKGGGAKLAREESQLADLVGLWPRLPAAVRREILKLAKDRSK